MYQLRGRISLPRHAMTTGASCTRDTRASLAARRWDIWPLYRQTIPGKINHRGKPPIARWYIPSPSKQLNDFPLWRRHHFGLREYHHASLLQIARLQLLKQMAPALRGVVWVIVTENDHKPLLMSIFVSWDHSPCHTCTSLRWYYRANLSYLLCSQS